MPIDFTLTDEQRQMQTSARKFAQNELRPVVESADKMTDPWEAFVATKDVYKKAYELGLAMAFVPKEYGGGGLSPMEQFIFRQEMAGADAPHVGGQGTRQLGATLIVHGSDEQKREHLPKILNGEVNWRQGYSEPGSGSDLASLQTRAVRDVEDYVINGQ